MNYNTSWNKKVKFLTNSVDEVQATFKKIKNTKWYSSSIAAFGSFYFLERGLHFVDRVCEELHLLVSRGIVIHIEKDRRQALMLPQVFSISTSMMIQTFVVLLSNWKRPTPGAKFFNSVMAIPIFISPWKKVIALLLADLSTIAMMIVSMIIITKSY